MPTILKRISLAAGGTHDNALANSQYEFAPFDGTIEIGVHCNAASCSTSIFSGPDVLAEPGTAVPFVVGTERLPVYPDDYPFEDEVAQGDRLKVTLVNASAGTAVFHVALRLTPA